MGIVQRPIRKIKLEKRNESSKINKLNVLEEAGTKSSNAEGDEVPEW